ncbi:prolyl 4-hydroxylase subunit alpha-1-like [Centruroides sculpturatus]|uniref:prolyl 4-hydroxylase subunit alpha-1-like n=1 Tax=Centruroides sculpturatus TaxID=218467 RepID=UPI000C6DF37F|nr:prolyl 4-hydroxylase subunit alpha-1-like [Centruroides sculpturatus]
MSLTTFPDYLDFRTRSHFIQINGVPLLQIKNIIMALSWRLVISFLFMVIFMQSRGEMFTAVVELERLLYTEGEIVKTLEKYLETEENRLQKVRNIREEYGKLYNTASQNIQTFLANPVNAYLLVKRLTADWKATENLLLSSEGRALIENITRFREDLKFPDDEDLTGAAAALLRLQDTYKLETSSLAKGLIKGVKPSPELTAGDCFELGRQSYNSGDHYHTVLWMQESLDRVDEEVNKTADKPEILEYLAFSTYMSLESKIHVLPSIHDKQLDASQTIHLHEQHMAQVWHKRQNNDEEKNAFKSLGTGNRIATWLNYMSDVEAGGGTVFPQIGVAMWPKKGSAAFWYNLHKNGEGDMLTRHAACPVLAGSKWVSNKWMHERGQEFRRQCGLRFTD